MIAFGEDTDVATLNRSDSFPLAEALYISGDDVQMCLHANYEMIRVLATTDRRTDPGVTGILALCEHRRPSFAALVLFPNFSSSRNIMSSSRPC